MNPLNRRQMLGMTPLLALDPSVPAPTTEDLTAHLVRLRSAHFQIDSASLAAARAVGLDLLHQIRSLFLSAYVNDQGVQNWFRDGLRHRDDGPALIRNDGTRFWYRKGKLHRDGGPAVEFPNGDLYWFRDGCRHRDDGPAILVQCPAAQYWFRDGKLHREDGPAVIDQHGSWWYANGLMHRQGGPAVELISGTKRWFRDGKLHREDGPAVEGKESRYWYQNDILRKYEGPTPTSINYPNFLEHVYSGTPVPPCPFLGDSP